MGTPVRIEKEKQNAVERDVSRDLAVRKAVQRHKRAQSLAAMGLVTREGDRFRVMTPAPRGKQTGFDVWRDEQGRVRCSCPEYSQHVTEDQAFRCEHILAVKHTLSSATLAPRVEQLSDGKPTPAQTSLIDPVTSASVPQNGVSELTDELMTDSSKRGAECDEKSSVVSLPEVNGEPGSIENRLAEFPAAERTSFANVVSLPFANLLRTLRQPVDPRLVKMREGWKDRSGNTHMVEYVEWHTVADILDRVAPMWSHSVRNITQIGDMVAITAAITIDGVTREGVGTGTAESEVGIKKAEHDALKRAAIKFGIARDLYQRESDVIERQGTHSPSEFPKDPLAKSLADLVTPKQLGMIRAMGREIGCDVEKECGELMSCGTEELSRRAASGFIDYLKRQQQERNGETAPDEILRAS
jgi:hypothetical protein